MPHASSPTAAPSTPARRASLRFSFVHLLAGLVMLGSAGFISGCDTPIGEIIDDLADHHGKPKPDPQNDPCATVRCASGTHCEVQEVVCIKAPCPPIAQCVPDKKPTAPFCGGIAGIQCPGSGKCVDDPSDSCDPAKGGADCGGLCTCPATSSCKPNEKFDSSPNVCACVPPKPVTCGPVCAIFCEFGNVTDASGCPTCKCNPAPTK